MDLIQSELMYAVVDTEAVSVRGRYSISSSLNNHGKKSQKIYILAEDVGSLGTLQCTTLGSTPSPRMTSRATDTGH
jgi:hypothetical protein